MLTEQQKQWRKSGLGGSDIAAIMGLSPWRTPLQIYLSKIGENVEQEDNAAMYYGSQLEPIIAQRYAEKHGVKVIRFESDIEPFRHKNYDFMQGNYDAIVQNNHEKWGLEIKTSRFDDNWGAEGTDEIPVYYLTQVHHYLTIAHANNNINRWDVAVLIGGNDERDYTVNYNEQISTKIIQVASEFWEHVQKRIPPALTTMADWELKYNNLTDTKIEATDYILAKVKRLYELKFISKNLDDEAILLKAEIMDFMQTNKTLCKNKVSLGNIIKAEYPVWDNDALNKNAELVQKYKTGVTKKIYFNFSKNKQLNKILGVSI